MEAAWGEGGRRVNRDCIRYLVVMPDCSSKASKNFIAIKNFSGPFSFLSVHFIFFFLINLFIYLFIFGCIGSSLLRAGFL